MGESIIHLLHEVPIFDKLELEELELVEKRLFAHLFSEGDIVFNEGTTGNYVCFVVNGVLEVIKHSTNRNDGSNNMVVITTLSRGQSIGEMSIIDGLTHSATVRAKTETSVLILSRIEFDMLLDEFPRIGIKILKGISRLLSLNLRKTSNDLTELMLTIT